MEFRSKSLGVLLALSLMTSSCAYYDEKNPPDPSLIVPGTITWNKVYDEFFEPRCALCHSNGEDGINVSDYNDVLKKINRIKQEVLTRKQMPPDSPLTSYEETLISTWINSGVPY